MENSLLSIIIITCDEEQNLPRCLASLPRADEVIIVDSYSNDRTCLIAEDFGAKLVQRPFKNHGDQKNFALSLATKPWVLSIDADEQWQGRLPNLAETTIAGFRINRQLVFMGKKMRFGKTRDAPLRLFRRELGAFSEAIHEHVTVDGAVRRYQGARLFHFSYQNLSDYFNRFNSYTSLIAENHWRKGKTTRLLPHLVRPWFEFVSRYIFRLGILDGRQGYTYALISSIYAYIKYEKLHEKSQHHG